jgi:large subunit ribosomal protein L35
MARKAKTHKWSAKRFKVTATGKFFHKKAWKNHLLVNKGSSLRNNKSWKIVSQSDAWKLTLLLPYV